MVDKMQKNANLNPMNEIISQSHCFIYHSEEDGLIDNHGTHTILEIKGEVQTMTIGTV